MATTKLRYSMKKLYIEPLEGGYVQYLRKNYCRYGHDTFDWVSTECGMCEVYDVPSFKEAIEGRRIKVIDLRDNTIEPLYIKGTKFEDKE